MPSRSNHQFSHVLARWVLGAHRHAAIILFSAVALTALSAFYTVENFSIHTDTDEMIDPELPFRREYSQFNQTFPQLGDNFVAIVRADIPEQAERAAEQMVARLEADPARFKSVYAPGTGQFFIDNGFLFLDQEELTELIERLVQAQPVLAQLIERPTITSFFEILELAVDNALEGEDEIADLDRVFSQLTPIIAARNRGETKYLSWQRLFSPEEDNDARRFVVVQPVLDATKLQPAKASLEAARTAARQVTAAFPDDQVSIEFTGKIALNTEELRSVSEGATLAGILSLVFVALVLGFGVRSARLVFAALATLVMGLIWTGAFAILTIGYLNIISVAFAVLFIGLGIDFAIHTILRYQEEVDGAGGQQGAFKRMAEGVGGPLCICAPTTALAFFAFTPTAYAGLAQLGLISGAGIFISLITSLTIIPAILRFMPIHRGRRAVLGRPEAERSLIRRYGRLISFTGLAVGLVATIAIMHVRFEFDPLKLKDPETPSVQAFLRLLNDAESSPYALQVLGEGMADAAAKAERLKQMAITSRVVWLGSYVPEDQDVKLEMLDNVAFTILPLLTVPPIAEDIEESASPNDALSSFRSKLSLLAETDHGAAPEARDLADALAGFDAQAEDGARYEGLETAVFAFWPMLVDRLESGLQAGPVGPTDVPEPVAARYRNDATYRIEVFPSENLSDQRALRQFVEQVEASMPRVTGSPVQMVRAGEIVVQSMRNAVMLAGALIVAFLFLVMRSLVSVVLVLMPVALAAVLTLAASVLLNIPFNFANVIVLPLLIGLGVDSGIHLVLRAREEAQPEEMLATSTPRAVFLSALTTVGSFGTLIISDHRGTASMGELLTISVLLTLLCTLVVLPAVLSWLHGRKKVTKH